MTTLLELTPAQTAAALRVRFRELLGTDAKRVSVRTDVYSQGSTIRVALPAELLARVGGTESVDKLERQYSFGRFDGSTDSTLFSNHTIMHKGQPAKPGALYCSIRILRAERPLHPTN